VIGPIPLRDSGIGRGERLTSSQAAVSGAQTRHLFFICLIACIMKWRSDWSFSSMRRLFADGPHRWLSNRQAERVAAASIARVPVGRASGHVRRGFRRRSYLDSLRARNSPRRSSCGLVERRPVMGREPASIRQVERLIGADVDAGRIHRVAVVERPAQIEAAIAGLRQFSRRLLAGF
jgi:hypothetical protein